MRAAVDAQYERLEEFLTYHSPTGPFLFDSFGWAETALTPLFKRLWFLEYYEHYAIPARLRRLLKWRAACLEHPAAQRHGFEELMKLYYDYTQGAGNGRLPAHRSVSSFTLDPNWRSRPMPPRDKWKIAATDVQLGLLV